MSRVLCDVRLTVSMSSAPSLGPPGALPATIYEPQGFPEPRPSTGAVPASTYQPEDSRKPRPSTGAVPREDLRAAGIPGNSSTGATAAQGAWSHPLGAGCLESSRGTGHNSLQSYDMF